ncbi:DUF4765 family protein [Streptomyces sp. NPDC048290]|uniref:DUF4765 family protein n=1 Tax=Streptomyces sp. NPDC048290 TaxID=3155811 RepID=UPI00343D183B
MSPSHSPDRQGASAPDPGPSSGPDPAGAVGGRSDPKIITTQKTSLSPDHDDYDSDNDDFAETVAKGKLVPKPKPEAEVRKAVASGSAEWITLWRGMSRAAADELVRAGRTPGSTADEPRAPTEAERKSQVQKGSTGNSSGPRLLEFTTDMGVAESFSYGSRAMVVAEIQARHLVKGSEPEGGWIPYWGAPVNVSYIVDRRGLPESRTELRGNAP